MNSFTARNQIPTITEVPPSAHIESVLDYECSDGRQHITGDTNKSSKFTP